MSSPPYPPSQTGLQHLFITLAQRMTALFQCLQEPVIDRVLVSQRSNQLIEAYNTLESYYEHYCTGQQQQISQLQNKLLVKEMMIDSLHGWTHEFARSKGLELELVEFMIHQISRRSAHAAS